MHQTLEVYRILLLQAFLLPSAVTMHHDDSGSVRRRRSARSLDLDSRTKAAAWVWHMRSKSKATDGRFVSQTRSSERKTTRFGVDATQGESLKADESLFELGVGHNVSTRRRSAYSLDFDSRPEAATSVSYTEWKSNVTDGRFVSRRSIERKEAPFRVQAFQGGSQKTGEAASTQGVWDCGSNLYDSLELVSFSNQLDRSLMGLLSAGAANFHHVASPIHQAPGLLRTFSLPRNMSVNRSSGSDSRATLDAVNCPVLVPRTKERTALTKKYSPSWCVAKLVNVFRKAATLRDRMRRPKGSKDRQFDEEERAQRHYRHVHHHHHHHHHYVYRLDGSSKAGSIIAKKYEVGYTGPSGRRTESARFSTDSVAKICSDKNWW